MTDAGTTAAITTGVTITTAATIAGMTAIATAIVTAIKSWIVPLFLLGIVAGCSKDVPGTNAYDSQGRGWPGDGITLKYDGCHVGSRPVGPDC